MRVFLSHAHEDKEVVKRFSMRLMRRGVDIWIDDGRMRAGDRLDEHITGAINACNIFLLFVSESSRKSDWVRRELDQALERERNGSLRIVPVLIAGTSVPDLLRGRLYLDCPGVNFNEDFSKLAHALNIDRFVDLTVENLDEVEFRGVISQANRLAAFVTVPSVDDEYIYRDLDGKPFLLQDLYILDAVPGRFRAARLSQGRLGHCCIGEDKEFYVGFANLKPSPGTYSMVGARWFIRRSDLALQRVEDGIFLHNAGWLPVFKKGFSVNHLSCDGYREWCDGDDLGPIDASVMEKRHNDYVQKISSGLMPGPKDRIIDRIRKVVSG